MTDTPNSPGLPRPVDRPWLALAGLTLGVMITNGFARFAYGLILPAMKSELGWTYAQAGWLNTANALGYVVGAVLTLLLIGRIAPSRLFSFGLVATTLSLLATGYEATMGWQTFWRIAAGVFGAMSFSTASVLTARLFPGDAKRNALAIAILFGTGGGLGIMLAGASLPLMLEAWGPSSWRFGWYIIGILSVIAAPLGLWSARALHVPASRNTAAGGLALRRIWRELAGYAGFAMGYIVYLTFLGAWMTDQQASAGLIAGVWIILGVALILSPFVWRGVFARHKSGRPLAMILTGIAIGSALPVVLPAGGAVVISAVVFGLCVFMAPGAITNFIRQNLPPESWAATMSLFTVVFAVAQTVGPFAAGAIGDATGDIGSGLLVAAAILLTGAFLAAFQKPLDP
ncbi:YbfB/YjiJ family MFS transporter [Sulfitobacter sp.]|uniref:YbfB/YjiJ family MFS transporter n=1 Tax=Sulfitobacter sp. TaxID=1903071 RepID=UPI003562AA6A